MLQINFIVSYYITILSTWQRFKKISAH